MKYVFQIILLFPLPPWKSPPPEEGPCAENKQAPLTVEEAPAESRVSDSRTLPKASDPRSFETTTAAGRGSSTASIHLKETGRNHPRKIIQQGSRYPRGSQTPLILRDADPPGNTPFPDNGAASHPRPSICAAITANEVEREDTN